MLEGSDNACPKTFVAPCNFQQIPKFFELLQGCAMPYNYQYDMATSKATVVFKLLFRWRGSVWRAVYVEYFIWLSAYAILSCVYRFALNTEQQGKFEKFAEFCDKRLSYIPMNFMLGFFVTVVVNRWVTQFANLGMIDNIALFTSQLVKGNDDRGKNLRRNIVRYCVASQCLVFRDIHLGVRRRFPTLETMVAAGFLQKHELEKFMECKSRYAKYWLPFNWALHLLNVALEEKRLDGDIPRNAIAQEIRSFRTGLSLIWTYDWVPLPVMYPQLVFMAVHTYFFVCVFSRQFIITPTAANYTVDLYFPIMSSLEFIFYVGWMKVAMELLNPFGEDDDDFDCNFLLDRNLTISLTAVDEAFDDIPDVKPDIFWDDTVSPLYSQETAGRAVNFYVGSANRAELSEDVTEIKMVPHPTNEKFDQYIKKPVRRRRTSIVSVVKTPQCETPASERKRSGSHLLNPLTIFQRKPATTIGMEEAARVNAKPRSSTDVADDHVRTASYLNPTFFIETGELSRTPSPLEPNGTGHLHTRKGGGNCMMPSTKRQPP
ncbi:bestrophin-3 domain protein [Ancylostoma duodenale]|uniref:Bestrophin homolog n=1 Tax=Ancylostoma duodenale TaxID=51022 RepID=A0A0C2D7L9_9BILA|nr:bestrophin-3 domain protein [Ancylostoma duodenale]